MTSPAPAPRAVSIQHYGRMMPKLHTPGDAETAHPARVPRLSAAGPFPVALEPDLALRQDNSAQGGTGLAPRLRDLALVLDRGRPSGHEREVTQARETRQTRRRVLQRFLVGQFSTMEATNFP